MLDIAKSLRNLAYVDVGTIGQSVKKSKLFTHQSIGYD